MTINLGVLVDENILSVAQGFDIIHNPNITTKISKKSINIGCNSNFHVDPPYREGDEVYVLTPGQKQNFSVEILEKLAIYQVHYFGEIKIKNGTMTSSSSIVIDPTISKICYQLGIDNLVLVNKKEIDKLFY